VDAVELEAELRETTQKHPISLLFFLL